MNERDAAIANLAFMLILRGVEIYQKHQQGNATKEDIRNAMDRFYDARMEAQKVIDSLPD